MFDRFTGMTDVHLRRASVDLETDSKIQQTIQTEFKDKTLLCIARKHNISPDVPITERNIPFSQTGYAQSSRMIGFWSWMPEWSL